LVKEGNLDLDEYCDLGLISLDDYRIVRTEEHIYPYFPVGTSVLVAVPLLLHRFVMSAIGVRLGGLSPLLEMQMASLVVALCTGVIYLVGRVYLDRPRSLFLALVFAFCTSAWSTASRGLWQHGPSMLMLSLTLLFVLLAEKRPVWLPLAGLSLAYSVVIRPTNAISVVGLSVYVLVRHRGRSLGYVGLGALVGALFAGLNWRMWGAPLAPYYMPRRLGTNTAIWEALAGNLVSPARGLLVFSPVLLALPWGVYLKAREKVLARLDVALISILGLHLLAISAFGHWWGGHSYGPRFFTDVIPYFVYLMIPVMARVSTMKGEGGFVYSCVMVLLATLSALIHRRGATVGATADWNSWPTNVDEAPARLWDWRDPQFLRGDCLLDGLLYAPDVSVVPDRAVVWRELGHQEGGQVSVELRDRRDKRFRWWGRAPMGVTASPAEGEGASCYSVVVTTSGLESELGAHSLGELEVHAAGGRFRSRRKSRVAVPIDAVVIDEKHNVYLPLALGRAQRRGHDEQQRGPGKADRGRPAIHWPVR
jgi:hypothetical protein